jgi:hypothetical protein
VVIFVTIGICIEEYEVHSAILIVKVRSRSFLGSKCGIGPVALKDLKEVGELVPW